MSERSAKKQKSMSEASHSSHQVPRLTPVADNGQPVHPEPPKAHYVTDKTPRSRRYPASSPFRYGWDIDDRFYLQRILGKGSYGAVAEAIDTLTGRRVAIKRIRDLFRVFENTKRIFREITILRQLQHPHIVKIVHVERPQDFDRFNELYVVFEAMDTDMAKLIDDTTQCITVQHVRYFTYQLLCSVHYMHSAAVIHRDIKPANVLLTEACDLKLCDFGLARAVETTRTPKPVHEEDGAGVQVTGLDGEEDGEAEEDVGAGEDLSEPKLARGLTKHVVTRWYRAPELPLYNDGSYSAAIDTWSVGCVFGEILSMLDTGNPADVYKRDALFPGGSCAPLTEKRARPDESNLSRDQLHVIFQTLGKPSEEEIARARTPEAQETLRNMPDEYTGVSLEEKYPAATEECIELLRGTLALHPEDRMTMKQALALPFFDPVRRPECEQPALGPVKVPDVAKHNVREALLREISHYNPGMLPEIDAWKADRA